MGFLGSSELDYQAAHALGFATALEEIEPSNLPVSRVDQHRASPGPAAAMNTPTDGSWIPARVVDLGSGGGLPGLVLATRWTTTRFVLMESNRRRATFLRESVDRLALGTRVDVVEERAEAAARDPNMRAAFDLAVARSFGPPAVTAECAAGFLMTGGLLVVSEPPDPPGDPGSSGRWPPDGLAILGMQPLVASSSPFHYQVLRQASPCPDKYPRAVGIPAKRPIFRPRA
jgi:16S rRNA (guanine527-N7)-methyltransferase